MNNSSHKYGTNLEKLFYKNNFFIRYIIIPSIPLLFLSIIAAYYPNIWTSATIHHFYIEIIGTVLGSILAFYYISRGYVINDKFSLFVGIGFLFNSLIDVLHVSVSISGMYDMLFLKYFIPQTWFAGKFFLAAVMLIAIINFSSFMNKKSPFVLEQKNSQKQKQTKYHIKNNDIINSNIYHQNRNIKQDYSYRSQNRKKEILYISSSYLLLSILVIALIFLSVGSLFIIFPYSIIDNFPIHRIYEIIPLVLFVIALYYFYKHRIYQEKDILYKSLVLFIVVNIYGQVIMSYSAKGMTFDTAANISHLLKVASYFIAIIGISLSNLSYNVKLIQSSSIIEKQYQQLQEAEKTKKEFINIAAHELRNPIQPIMGLSTIMLDYIHDRQTREYLVSILNNSKRLKDLTESLLDVAKIYNNTLKIHNKIINLNILVSQIIKEHSPEITLQEKKIKLEFKLVEKQDILIEADPDRLKQVISNLLDNALNFTNSDDSITVIVQIEKGEKGEYLNKKDNENVVISVIDTGEGISTEIFDKLFSKFTTKNSVKGSGLGLYISKKIIEAHGGIIWAENPLNKKGAILKFTLPIKTG